MLIVDCPLCERPAPFDAEDDALECDACGVRLELAASDAGRPARRRLTDRGRRAETAPRGRPRRDTVLGVTRVADVGAHHGRLDRRMDFRKYSAELVGSFIFFSIGYLSIPAFANASAPGAPNLLVVPWAFGLGLLAAIFAFGHISGGHFNPAVTIAMVLDKRTTPMDAVGYILSQIIGAIAAAVVVHARAQPGRRSRRASRPPARASATSAP